MSIVRVKGSVWDTQDNLVVDLLNDLRSAHPEGIIFVSGRHQPNDGNGGWFKWNAVLPVSQDDGLNVIASNKAARGCWVRQNFMSSPPARIWSELQIAKAGQKVFQLHNFTYTPGQGEISIYINGTRLTTQAFVETDEDTITLNTGIRAGDTVEILWRENPTLGTTGQISASTVEYDASQSTLTQTNLQDVIDEIDMMMQTLASIGGGGAAGGVLPTFHAKNIAVDQTVPGIQQTQEYLDYNHNEIMDHIHDPTNAHRATAIWFDPRISGLPAANIQQAIDQISQKIGSGHAADVTFDSSALPDLVSINLQSVVEELLSKITDNAKHLTEHRGDTGYSHSAGTIHYSSAAGLLAPASDVEQALSILEQAIGNQVSAAIDISFDNLVSTMPALNVQEAIDWNSQQIALHSSPNLAPGMKHASSEIDHVPISGMHREDVQGAIYELFGFLETHKTRLIDAHDASAIRFNNGGTGLRSNSVQGAIIEAMGMGMAYRGHLDVTTAADGSEDLSKGGYYTVMIDGPLDASWNTIIVNAPPGGVIQGDMLLADGTSLNYLPNTNPNLGRFNLVSNPLPGTSQQITTAAIGDSALILYGVAGQQAPLLDINGKAVFDTIESRHDIIDALGNVRQDAAHVEYDGTNSHINVATVQAAIDKVQDNLNQHTTGASQKHPASAIVMAPPTGLVGTTVDSLITSFYKQFTDHATGTGAHSGKTIIFDNAGTTFQSSNVEDAIKELAAGSTGGGGIGGPLDLGTF